MSAPDVPSKAPLVQSSHFAHEYATHKVTEVVLLLVNWLSKNQDDAPLARARELLAEARRARGAADKLFQLHEAARAEGSLGYPGGPCGPQPGAQPEHANDPGIEP
jgi:hypothetical protein